MTEIITSEQLEKHDLQETLRALKKFGFVSITNSEKREKMTVKNHEGEVIAEHTEITTTFVMSCDFTIGAFKSRLQIEGTDLKELAGTLLQHLMALHLHWKEISMAVAEAEGVPLA